ncbi:MAG: lysophospholipid acyltransferase family protein [Eubacteriales bacterium]|nr:lysophospholipid acyltransferase family protein [Eubacteriales bacterium]MDD3880701.1 lysophospholipid acyltransferase family protein [Eubacteriales bacterium]MDD4511665.1 lysophospholipid acyltransferase family protein [Eubacteriales bacterium]
MRIGAFFVDHICAKVTILHGERLSSAQPAIIVANHLSMADPFLIGGRCRYNIRFLGKEELYKNPIIGAFLRGLESIPVKRHKTDMASMRACVGALKDGRVLGIFPEGTRHSKGMLQEAETGTAMIALRSKVPVIPVLIERKYRWFTHNYVYVGTPLEYADICEKGISTEGAEEFMERLREKYPDMKKRLDKERA